MKLLRPPYLQTCAHEAMNVYIYTESYKNTQKYTVHVYSSWCLEFCGQRSALFSIEPVTSSLSECGQATVGPEWCSQGMKLIISKILTESYKWPSLWLMLLTWNGGILFIHIPGSSKDCVWGGGAGWCGYTHHTPHAYANCKWSLDAYMHGVSITLDVVGVFFHGE